VRWIGRALQRGQEQDTEVMGICVRWRWRSMDMKHMSLCICHTAEGENNKNCELCLLSGLARLCKDTKSQRPRVAYPAKQPLKHALSFASSVGPSDCFRCGGCRL
jgi:hypothetical protein